MCVCVGGVCVRVCEGVCGCVCVCVCVCKDNVMDTSIGNRMIRAKVSMIGLTYG